MVQLPPDMGAGKVGEPEQPQRSESEAEQALGETLPSTEVTPPVLSKDVPSQAMRALANTQGFGLKEGYLRVRETRGR